MPHQCVRCGNFYDDGSSEILKGCPCGGRLFFYIKKQDLKRAEEATNQLDEREKKEIEKDVFDLIGYEEDKNRPVVLDFESINISQPGKYEIDLVHLFKKEPLVYKVGEGKYIIDLPETFKEMREEED